MIGWHLIVIGTILGLTACAGIIGMTVRNMYRDYRFRKMTETRRDRLFKMWITACDLKGVKH